MVIQQAAAGEQQQRAQHDHRRPFQLFRRNDGKHAHLCQSALGAQIRWSHFYMYAAPLSQYALDGAGETVHFPRRMRKMKAPPVYAIGKQARQGSEM